MKKRVFMPFLSRVRKVTNCAYIELQCFYEDVRTDQMEELPMIQEAIIDLKGV